MPFEEYTPRGLVLDPIPEGHCSITKSGQLTIRKSDLALVGIGETVAVLTDSSTLRIALRKPRPGKPCLNIITIHRGKVPDPTWVRVTVGGAIHALRLELEAVAGRFEITTKEDLLIINLGDVTPLPGDDDEETDEE